MGQSARSERRNSLSIHRVVHVEAPPSEARRALFLHDLQLVADLIELALHHGLFVVRAARNLADAEAIVSEWRPHMGVVDMDHEDSTVFIARLGASNA